MDAGLVSAFDGLGLKGDRLASQGGLTVPRQTSAGEAGIRKQRSQRFTVPLSPPRQNSASPSSTSLGGHSQNLTSALPYQPSPLPVQSQSVPATEELYSTTSNGNYDADSSAPETQNSRREYAGSSGSSNASDDESPLPPSVTAASVQASLPLHYPQHQPPLFYNSTSHSSMPLSPPSLFNLVPGGSPGFTYHHSFPNPAPSQQHQQSFQSYQPLPHPYNVGDGSSMGGFGLGVGTGEDGMNGGYRMGMIGRNPSPSYQTDVDNDEIIETAIVIKSIPFSCPKDQLLGLMASLQLPSPLAFNYHYDLSLNPGHQQQEPRQDQFRGLAFANFRNGEEASVVVCALNGFEFMGRKLRAEFKKVLKPGEKEAIERNKALKRIRSVQLLGGSNNGPPHQSQGYQRGPGWGEGTGHGIGDRNGGAGNGWNRREASAPGGYYRGAYGADEGMTEDYGRLLHAQGQPLAPKTSFGHREYVLPSGVGMAYENSGESAGGSGSVGMSGSASGSGSVRSIGLGNGGPSGSGSDSEEGVGSSISAREERKKDLDLNDPQTLQVYSQLLLFSSLPSPPNPSTTEMEGLDSSGRRKVKMVAGMLGLGYGSEEVGGGGKRVLLWKAGQHPGPQQPLRSTTSAAPLRRHASTSSFHSTPTASSSFAPPPVPALPAFSAYLATPGSGGLRGKKSMPEFRPSSASSFYAADAPPMPDNSFTRSQSQSNGFGSRKSTNNLRSQPQSQYQPHTISSFPSAVKRSREVPTVKGLFQQQGILPDSEESSPIEEQTRKEYYSTGSGLNGSVAEAVRQPRGPGLGEVAVGRGAGEGALEWRNRRN